MSEHCANSLLRDWVQEWMEQAQSTQSKSYYTFRKAYDSLSRCPITFEHPSQAQQLEGIGKVLAERLTKKMIEHCKKKGLPAPSPFGVKRAKKSSDGTDTEEEGSSSKPKRPRKAYIPTFRSGAYAILLCLLDMQAEGRDSLTKEQICTYGQKYCNTSMTFSDPGKSYTAFSGIKTLADKGYVYKNGRPTRYMLTETGSEMAEKLRNAGNDSELSQTLESNPSQSIASQSRDPSSNSGKGKQPARPRGSRTPATLEDMLGPDFDLLEGPDMSSYVLNPSEHQSITINGKTVINNQPSDPNSSSALDDSITNKQQFNFKQAESNYKDTASTITRKNDSPLTIQILQSSDEEMDDILGPNYMHKAESPTSSIASTSREADVSSRNKPTKKDASILYSDDDVSSQNKLVTRNTPILCLDDSDVDEFDLLSQTTNFESDLDLPLSQSQNTDDAFHFTYLDTSNRPVRHVSSAAIDFDDENTSLIYLIRFHRQQRDHPKAKRLVNVQDDQENYCTGYLLESERITICPGLPPVPAVPLYSQEIDDFWPNDNSQGLLKSNSESNFSQLTFDSQTAQSITSSQLRQREQVEVDVSQLIESEHIEPILSDEYEIMLILDSREIQMRNNRNYIQDRLISKGINLSTRSLDLGDVIWVARKKNSTRQSDELFLDYIVERKRLDDLVSSIKDGRFTEQKTRLKKSGAKKVIYVVEEYNREDAVNFGIQAIQTAMSSTQIIDGIFLKRTNSIDDTIDYLVSLTRMIERMYRGTTLYPIPEHVVTSQNYLQLREAYREKAAESNTAYLVSYTIYNIMNSKNGGTNLHEIYLRMLMCVKGVNAEKALALMRVYTTPHSLLSAFRNKTAKDGKNLAKEATQTQISRRRWGGPVSERLYEVWSALEYKTSETFSD